MTIALNASAAASRAKVYDGGTPSRRRKPTFRYAIIARSRARRRQHDTILHHLLIRHFNIEGRRCLQCHYFAREFWPIEALFHAYVDFFSALVRQHYDALGGRVSRHSWYFDISSRRARLLLPI